MEEKICKFCNVKMNWRGGGQKGLNPNEIYMESKCPKCDSTFRIEKTWTTKISRAQDKLVKKRSEEDHLLLIKEVHEGCVRKYLLSMGDFKDVEF